MPTVALDKVGRDPKSLTSTRYHTLAQLPEH
jgi:hypothetical protein